MKLAVGVFVWLGWLSVVKGLQWVRGFPYRVVKTLPVKELAEGMQWRNLGSSNLLVSQLGLGTMTFGRQVSPAESMNLLDMAVDQFQINFIDMAESYPLPHRNEEWGRAEAIVGKWLQKRPTGFRDQVVLATAVSGYDHLPRGVRPKSNPQGGTRLTKEQLEEAVDQQLRRLKVDHIDLLQIHWPERPVPDSRMGLNYEDQRQDATSVYEQLRAIESLLASGKIRHYGLCNETPFGVGLFIGLANATGVARPVSVQTAYNLLERNQVECGLAEACAPTSGNLGLIAHSTLAGGVLSGKYVKDASQHSSEWRLRRYPGYQAKFVSERCRNLVTKYKAIAKENYEVPLATLAQGWVYGQKHVNCALVGVTNEDQLLRAVAAMNFDRMGEDVLQKINDVYRSDVEPSTWGDTLVDLDEEEYPSAPATSLSKESLSESLMDPELIKIASE